MSIALGNPAAPSAVERAYRALLGQFVCFGVMAATWIVRIPDVQTALGLSTQTLGFVLAGGSVGGLLAMPLGGWMTNHFGSRTTAQVLMAVGTLGLVGLATAPHAAVLFAANVLYGCALSGVNLAMNVQGAAIERASGRGRMLLLHGFFGVGFMGGSLVGGPLAAAGVAPLWHLGAAALLMGAAAQGFLGLLLPRRYEAHAAPGGVRFSKPLVLIGLVALCCLVAESTVGNWGVKHMRDTLGAPPDVAAWGFTAYAGAMMAGRLAGDRLRARWSPVALLRLGGLVGALGLTVAAYAPSPAVGIVGFAVAGAGLSLLFPLFISAAGRQPGVSMATAVTTVLTLASLGTLLNQPAIGTIAEATSLRVAFLLPIAASLGVAALARVVKS